MKDGTRPSEQVEVSRQEVYEDYMKCYLQQCTEVRPCRDAGLLKKAARYLLTEPEPRENFTTFPFYQALSEGCLSLNTDYRKLLSAFIKAVELLETICVNLYLQPWKKEIKTLKTFTGPFVYFLLPVFSSSTIQSVLASIGYLPHTDTPQSEYRLSEDANPDRATVVGFELLLARVECCRLLELFEKDQLNPQEWLDVLQTRGQPPKLDEPTDKKTSTGHKEEEEEKKKEEADRSEAPACLNRRLAVKPQPKPRCCHPISADHSIIEMHMTYPDLAFRGRPLLSDKPHTANSSRSSSRTIQTASTDCHGDDRKATDLIRGNSVKDVKPVATSICSKTDDSTAAEELSHSQAASLHIILRAGSTMEQRLKPGEPQASAEPPVGTQQQTAAEPQSKRPASPGLPSHSSTEEEQELRELRELAETMGQLHVHETNEEVKRREAKTNKEKRKNEREAEERNLKRPVMETGTGPGLNHAAKRRTRASQNEPAVMREQKQLGAHHSSPLTVNTADCQGMKGGGTGQQEGGESETGRGEEEQLAHSYVIVERHNK